MEGMICPANGMPRKCASPNYEMDWNKVHKNVVIVGDGECGKTCLFNSYLNKELPTFYIPTIVDTFEIGIGVDDINYELTLTDTAGSEAYDRLRTLSYQDTDILILCFAVNSPHSFDNLTDKWILEVLHFCPNVPVVLVCTKVDLRDDLSTIAKLARIKQKPITTEEGKELAKDIGALAYIECSALKGLNITEVFETAVRTTLNKKLKSKKLKKMKQLHIKRSSMFELHFPNLLN